MDIFTGTLNDLIDLPMGIIHFESSIKPNDWIILKHLTAPRYKALRINQVNIHDGKTVELIYRYEQEENEQKSVFVDNDCNLVQNTALANEWCCLNILSLQKTGINNFEYIINVAREHEPKENHDRSLSIYFETMFGLHLETKIDYVSNLIKPTERGTNPREHCYLLESLEECVSSCWLVSPQGKLITYAKEGGDEIIQVDIQFDKY